MSSGTYIRSLAHELGRRLGCGAHLASLRRTRSGDFSLKQAVSLEKLEAAPFEQFLVDVKRVLPEMPNILLGEEEASRIRHGNATNLPVFSSTDVVKVFEGDDLIAIARRVAGSLFQPKVVLV